MLRAVSAPRPAVMTVTASTRSKTSSAFSLTSAASEATRSVSAPPVRSAAAASQNAAPTAALRQLFGASTSAAVTDPPFKPAFRSATGTDGQITWNLNSQYFATKETAQWIG